MPYRAIGFTHCHMAKDPVPVSMGSPRFTVRDVHRFSVTHAWFPPGARLEAHVHDRPTFALILGGSFDLVLTSEAIRRRELACPPGTLFTEPAGERHANRVGTGGASVIVFQPDPAAEELDAAALGVLDRINHFRHGGIAGLGRELAREVLGPDSVAPLAIEALALEMLVEAARLDEADRWLGATSSWMKETIEFVHAHFREPLRIRDVAVAAGVHPAHLAARFRQVHKTSIGAYIRRLRVDWAAERLARSEDSISAIAHGAGFADQAHLTRWFKRATGWTPGRYRRRHGARPRAARGRRVLARHP